MALADACSLADLENKQRRNRNNNDVSIYRFVIVFKKIISGHIYLVKVLTSSAVLFHICY